jgi:hypothetical protein
MSEAYKQYAAAILNSEATPQMGYLQKNNF